MQRGSVTGLNAPSDTNSAQQVNFSEAFHRVPTVVVTSTTVSNRVEMLARNPTTSGFSLMSGGKGAAFTNCTADWVAFLP